MREKHATTRLLIAIAAAGLALASNAAKPRTVVSRSGDLIRPIAQLTEDPVYATVRYVDGATNSVLKAVDTAKADKAKTLSGYGITNAYTKVETDLQVQAATNALMLAVTNMAADARVEFDAVTNSIYASLSVKRDLTDNVCLVDETRDEVQVTFSNDVFVTSKAVQEIAKEAKVLIPQNTGWAHGPVPAGVTVPGHPGWTGSSWRIVYDAGSATGQVAVAAGSISDTNVTFEATFGTVAYFRTYADFVDRAFISHVTEPDVPPDKRDLVILAREKQDDNGDEVRLEDENGAVVIGKGAVGTVSREHLETVTGRTEVRSLSVAIGMNAKATGGRDANTTQAIAIGPNSRALASNAIAIGAGAVHWFEDDVTGPGAVAAGSESVALGYGAKARASQAMQVGRGENAVSRSLKFFDTYVVKDGQVQGGVDTNTVRSVVSETLDPAVITEPLDEIEVRSHALTTFSPTQSVDEVYVTPTGTRNYELFLPNTPELRDVLPVSFATGIEGEVTKLGPQWTNKVLRLPCKVTMREPIKKTLILDVEEFETAWDWTPVVVSAVSTNDEVVCTGTNLHFAVQMEVGGVVRPVLNPLYGKAASAGAAPSGTPGTLRDESGSVLCTFAVE